MLITFGTMIAVVVAVFFMVVYVIGIAAAVVVVVVVVVRVLFAFSLPVGSKFPIFMIMTTIITTIIQNQSLR